MRVMFPRNIKKKRVILVFGIGFIVGMLLEVVLIEMDVLSLMKSQMLCFHGAEKDPKVACIAFLKRNFSESLIASEDTWLKHCDEFHAVRVNRVAKTGVFGRRKSATPENSARYDESSAKETCERSTMTSATNITADSAWNGLCRALRLIERSSCNWFILFPDNLFVLVRNLKSFVKDLNWNEEHYFGHAIRHYEADFNAFSAGILISYGALRKILGKFRSKRDCDNSGKYWQNEDLYLGKYFGEMGIYPKDTRDDEGRGRFHGYNIRVLSSPGKYYLRSDYYAKALYPVPQGRNCCSPQLITIDGRNAEGIYENYFYIYKVIVASGRSERDFFSVASDSADGFDWKAFLREEGYNETTIENMTDEEYYKVWAKKITPESLYEMMRNVFSSNKTSDIT